MGLTGTMLAAAPLLAQAFAIATVVSLALALRGVTGAGGGGALIAFAGRCARLRSHVLPWCGLDVACVVAIAATREIPRLFRENNGGSRVGVAFAEHAPLVFALVGGLMDWVVAQPALELAVAAVALGGRGEDCANVHDCVGSLTPALRSAAAVMAGDADNNAVAAMSGSTYSASAHASTPQSAASTPVASKATGSKTFRAASQQHQPSGISALGSDSGPVKRGPLHCGPQCGGGGQCARADAAGPGLTLWLWGWATVQALRRLGSRCCGDREKAQRSD